MSPSLFEQFARAAAAAAPHHSEDLPARAAQLGEDSARLREIADDPVMPTYARAAALDALAESGKADDAFVRARYQAMAANPDEATGSLVFFLESRNDFAGAVAALDGVIKADRHRGLHLVHLITEKARLQLRLGDANAAYRTIEPVLSSYKEETLLQGAAILLARQQPQAALELAQAALERYPDRSSETSGLIARARWQLGDYPTAARELAASRNGIVEPWNRYLPEGFAETFATMPEESTRRAFAELTAAGIAPHILADVAAALGRKRGLEIALPLLEGLHDPEPQWRNHIRLVGYDLIRDKADAAAALEWVRQQMPKRSHDFALHLYQFRKYDLLLGLFPNGEQGEAASMVRFVSVAALLHLRETTGPRWEAVTAAIAAEPKDDFYGRGARYLAGQIDDAAMLRPMVDGEELATLGWIMGVKASSERRFADADGWFQVALESGQEQVPPHAWTWAIESDWLETDRSLEILERREGEPATTAAR